MCLYVDFEHRSLSEGIRTARKAHRCDECERIIDPGERYNFWTYIDYDADGIQHMKMCAHCWGTIELGSFLTGCPQNWYWGVVHDLREEGMSFVGNVLDDPGHDLTLPERVKMLRTVAGRRRGWRRRDGTLLPIPQAPIRQAVAS